MHRGHQLPRAAPFGKAALRLALLTMFTLTGCALFQPAAKQKTAVPQRVRVIDAETGNDIPSAHVVVNNLEHADWIHWKFPPTLYALKQTAQAQGETLARSSDGSFPLPEDFSDNRAARYGLTRQGWTERTVPPTDITAIAPGYHRTQLRTRSANDIAAGWNSILSLPRVWSVSRAWPEDVDVSDTVEVARCEVADNGTLTFWLRRISARTAQQSTFFSDRRNPGETTGAANITSSPPPVEWRRTPAESRGTRPATRPPQASTDDSVGDRL